MGYAVYMHAYQKHKNHTFYPSLAFESTLLSFTRISLQKSHASIKVLHDLPWHRIFD